MRLLKQSTIATLVTPRMVDETDGKTPETALSLTQSDIRISKAGAEFAQKNDSASATHMESGFYSIPVNATDTGTLGILKVAIAESGAFPVDWDYMVLSANVYDAVVAGTDLLQVDVQALNDSATAADNLAASAGQIYTGVTDNTGFTGTTTIFETSSITTAASSHWIGRYIVFTAGTLAGQISLISAYSLSGGRGRFTYAALTSAPSNGTAFAIV